MIEDSREAGQTRRVYVGAVATREELCEGGKRNDDEVEALRISGVSLSKHWPALTNRLHLHHLYLHDRIRLTCFLTDSLSFFASGFLLLQTLHTDSCIAAAVGCLHNGMLMMSRLWNRRRVPD